MTILVGDEVLITCTMWHASRSDYTPLANYSQYPVVLKVLDAYCTSLRKSIVKFYSSVIKGCSIDCAALSIADFRGQSMMQAKATPLKKKK